jgi:hypothetical protein
MAVSPDDVGRVAAGQAGATAPGVAPSREQRLRAALARGPAAAIKLGIISDRGAAMAGRALQVSTAGALAVAAEGPSAYERSRGLMERKHRAVEQARNTSRKATGGAGGGGGGGGRGGANATALVAKKSDRPPPPAPATQAGLFSRLREDMLSRGAGAEAARAPDAAAAAPRADGPLAPRAPGIGVVPPFDPGFCSERGRRAAPAAAAPLASARAAGAAAVPRAAAAAAARPRDPRDDVIAALTSRVVELESGMAARDAALAALSTRFARMEALLAHGQMRGGGGRSRGAGDSGSGRDSGSGHDGDYGEEDEEGDAMEEEGGDDSSCEDDEGSSIRVAPGLSSAALSEAGTAHVVEALGSLIRRGGPLKRLVLSCAWCIGDLMWVDCARWLLQAARAYTGGMRGPHRAGRLRRRVRCDRGLIVADEPQSSLYVCAP